MCHNKLCLKSHRKKKILCIPLITSDMIFKGITELECIDNSLPSSFYLCYHKASEVSNLHSFILYLQSLKQQLSIPCCSTQLFHLLSCLMSLKIFCLLFSDMAIFFLRYLDFFFSPERNHFSAINDSLLMWKVALVGTRSFQYIPTS